MTDIDVSYYDGASWNDLSDYVTRFQIEESGIQKISTAMVNFRTTARSNLSSYLTNPYRLTRIRANNGGWQTLFYGYVNKPYLKTISGTISEKNKLSLDLNSFSARLAADTITYDFYALQSAITPYTTESISFKEMLQSLIDYPDSYDPVDFPYGAGFTVVAAADPLGIDRIIDGVSNWDNQTLFEAIRLTAEHLGMDGYYYLADEETAPEVRLYPYSKASAYTLTAPFIGEPTWEGGALDDISNKVFLEGGVDSGVPSDNDRWTEWGYTKYSPVAWSATSDYGSMTITDLNLRAEIGALATTNSQKAIRFLVDSGSNGYIYAVLDISRTQEASVDCLNRCSTLSFNLYPDVNVSGMALIITLQDSGGHTIDYAVLRDNVETQVSFFDGGEAVNINVPVGSDQAIYATPTLPFLFELIEQANDSKAKAMGNKWYYRTGSTTFDWEHVTKCHINCARFQYGGDVATYWAFEIDEMIFFGGQKIDFFNALNPPLSDSTSINTYGMHVYKHTDSTISSFEQATAEKTRLLANLAYPIDTLRVKKYAPTTQLYPSNVVTVNAVDYRIANISYEWMSKNKNLTAEYNLVEKTIPLPPIWTMQNELRYLIK